MTPDLSRIKLNMKQMLSQGANDQDLEDYASHEGVTAEQIKNYQVAPLDPLVYHATRAIKGIGSGVKALGDTLGAGTIEGGARLLQTGQNIGDLIQSTPPSKAIQWATGKGPDQTLGNLAKRARDYASNTGEFENSGIPVGKFRQSIPGMITEGLSQAPAMATEVEAMGGGIPGMAAQGFLNSYKGGPIDAAKGTGVGALLGGASKLIGGIKTAPENMPNVTGKYGDVIGKTLARAGLGGATFGGAAALEGGSPKEIAASAGQGAIMSGPQAEYTPEDIAKRLELLKAKGYKATAEHIPPDTAEQAEYKKLGLQHPIVEQGFQNIQPSKTFEQEAEPLEAKAKDLMAKREALLAIGPEQPSVGYTKDLFDELQKAYKSGNEDRAKALQKVYNKEVAWNKENPNPTAMDLEARKEDFAIRSGINKRGTVKDTHTAAGQDLIRQGIREQLENSVGKPGELKNLNEPYGGLTDAAKSLRLQGSDMFNARKPGPWLTTFSHALPFLIENPVYRLGSIAQQIAKSGESASISRDTSRIAALRDATQRLQKSTEPEKVSIEPTAPQLQLPPPAPLQLTRNRMSEIKGGSYLPPGQGSGPQINVPGSSTINMPEVTETAKQAKLKELVKTLGVPEYGSGPRVRMSEADIPKGVGAEESNPLIMPPQRANAVGEILARREKNLPLKTIGAVTALGGGALAASAVNAEAMGEDPDKEYRDEFEKVKKFESNGKYHIDGNGNPTSPSGLNLNNPEHKKMIAKYGEPEAAFRVYKKAVASAEKEYPSYIDATPEVRAVLHDIKYNFGDLSASMPKANKYLKQGEWAKAAYELGHNNAGGKSLYLLPKDNETENRRAVHNIQILKAAKNNDVEE